MKTTIKRIVSCVLFCALLLAMIARVNEIVLYKTYNRYYMLEQEIENFDQAYDVQIFGACHSYTSFHAPYFQEQYGLSAYDLGNPGEIVPVTYLQMLEYFKKDVPKVALVEIWGINAYETYSSQDRIFSYYMPVNIEGLPLSLEKMKVIRNYSSLDPLLENFPIAKYKDRIMSMELIEEDFDYTFDEIYEHTSDYTKTEMGMRFSNNGFCEMPMHFNGGNSSQIYTPYMNVSDYPQKQASVGNETLPLEEDMLKYVQKIVALCEEYDVPLIFYRAPYISTENELKKANWFEEYCASNDIMYFDLEKEMTFDFDTDFLDYEHLNQAGAKKATDFLGEKIMAVIND